MIVVILVVVVVVVRCSVVEDRFFWCMAVAGLWPAGAAWPWSWPAGRLTGWVGGLSGGCRGPLIAYRQFCCFPPYMYTFAHERVFSHVILIIDLV